MLLHAFAVDPSTYQRTIDLLAQRSRVIAPSWLRTPRGRRWSFEAAVGSLAATLDAAGIERVSVVGHSFGGALALAFAARHPERVRRLVLVDALAITPGKLQLARLAVPGRHLLALASFGGAKGFAGTALGQGRSLAAAGWWGFNCDLVVEADAVAAAGVDSVVLWAADDSLLPVSLGQRLAVRLGAPFLAVRGEDGGRRVDHDWAFRQPVLFSETLAAIGVPPLDG